MFIPLRDTNPRIRQPIVTYSLITANLAIFVLGLYTPTDSLAFYEDSLRLGTPGGIFGLISHQFLHGGWGHLIFNMWFLYVFGDNVEGSFGHVNFLAFYLACGAGAALSEVFLDPYFGSEGGGVMVGASGSISGVMAAYAVRYPKAKILTWFFFIVWGKIAAGWYVGIWILLQFLYQFLNPTDNVAYIAHIGGFICGLIFYQLFHTFKIGKRS